MKEKDAIIRQYEELVKFADESAKKWKRDFDKGGSKECCIYRATHFQWCGRMDECKWYKEHGKEVFPWPSL